MGKGHYPPIKPHKPVNPNPPDPNPHPQPQPAGVPLIWWTANADGRLKPDGDGKTDADKANVGIATLIIQRDDGTLWRVGEDKPPHTWTQIATGSGGGDKDPFTNFYPDRSADPKIPVPIKAWARVIDDSFGRTYQLPDLQPGECFEIVDVAQQFALHPVTLIRDKEDNWGFLLGKKIGDRWLDPTDDTIILDVTGEGSVWRFAVVEGDIVAVIVPTFSDG